jgi:hypothetical protein
MVLTQPKGHRLSSDLTDSVPSGAVVRAQAAFDQER